MSSTTLLRTLQTGHVGLNVTDLNRSIDFYRTVLGLQLTHEGTDPERRYAMLGRDGRLVITLWQQSTGAFSTGTPGLHHLSFEVESLGEVRATENLLRELGAEFAYDGVVPHGEGSASGGIFFSDPDGIRLEIYTRAGVDETPAEAPTTGAPTCGFF
ncbi:VOC family protein [Kitasatospora aureofaciens]|uniref:Glyoxalase n=1 Tax=Kitasatospora aureofaciens TaxID=1894 RepID=A0A1E7N4E3_KITAU|nr:VOC family protein [Kitasatospora aureofaciens]QEV00621.1 VOC family protein [Streptomyces viridifaciens]ARF79423.1 glyoxalase [Kitasatospora aureofaciens]OEV35534.1 glyoxalase [Kitasatospora aureofaciens]UKZ06890.1 VOC family protein [Streptomyces viridifaciens]GGU66373.1 lactoylglutathione lyase [Kitasatospora aureofaciens]